MTEKNKSLLKTIAKILISVVLFAVILLNIDRGELVKNIKLANLSFAPLIVLFILMNYFVGAIRWKNLLIHGNSEHVRVPHLMSLYLAGAFFNNFMPTSIGGDVYKMYGLGKRIKNNVDAFSATFMDRFTGVMALVLISYVGLVQTFDFWVGQLPASISSNSTYVLLFRLVLLFGFWICIAFGFYSMKFIGKKVKLVQKVYDSLIRYKGHYSAIAKAVGLSFVVQFFAIFTQYFVFKSLGVELPISYALFIFPVVTLASFMIPSLNGIGVQDALYIQFFSAVGVSSEIALSASIIYHLFRLVVSLFGGLLYAMGKAD